MKYQKNAKNEFSLKSGVKDLRQRSWIDSILAPPAVLVQTVPWTQGLRRFRAISGATSKNGPVRTQLVEKRSLFASNPRIIGKRVFCFGKTPKSNNQSKKATLKSAISQINERD
jgi:hypothetical protein